MAKTPFFQKDARAGLARSLADLEAGPDDGLIRAHCPDAWLTLEEDVEVREKKVHVTLRLDESVAAYYRAMGHGYQARINRILKTYAQMRVARVKALDRDAAPSRPPETSGAERGRDRKVRAEIMERWEALKRMTPEEREAARLERERKLAELGVYRPSEDVGEL